MPGLPEVTGRFHVDQFGYLPDERKIAVISDPQLGYNAAESFTPGPELQLRRVTDGAVVHRAAPKLFHKGQTDRASGDRGWWFEFTAVRESGDYYVYDLRNARRSHVFRIAPDVYQGVLRAAMRVFFYQREAFAHQPPHAEPPWVDAAAFLQDAETRSVSAKDDPATARDLSGGWMDAGDSNKYPTFLPEVLHPLLYAWRENPAAFGDDFGIPESGNGRPDILDEVKWELDWLVKMQDADGGVFIKMGQVDYAGLVWPLSRDLRPRYYGPKASASTLATAGILAHAARVYGQFPEWRDYAAGLRGRAERAWQWYLAQPRAYNVDTGEIKSGDADKDAVVHDRWEAIAGFHLWALTGKAEYHDVFRQRYAVLRQIAEPSWSPYESGQAEALLDYTRQTGADRQIASRILAHLRTSTKAPAFMPQDEKADLYRAWMVPTAYHWGSNIVLAGYGKSAVDAAGYLTRGVDRKRLRQRGLDSLHALHGVNPLGLVYLSNMGCEGAEVSVMRLYHEWYTTGSPLAAHPAPGYVTGGPNRAYGGTIEWLKQQPDTKCYADFNAAWPEASWEITEPAIYYQAMYVRLLASFARPVGQ
ncbi:MAG: glycoside hydrolase family 9 protein [Opitutaceae bacterium]|nr:glycoside hydrolase family 9 protein [Opitutaceae bacterium]